ASEAGYVSSYCRARALNADARFADAALGAVSDTATLRLSVGGAIEGFQPYDEFIGVEEEADLDDPVFGGSMLYTSGTTGRPKGVHRSRGAAAAAAATS